MDDTRNVLERVSVMRRRSVSSYGGFAYTKDGEENVDAEVTTASPLEEDAERREDHGENDLADVAGLIVSGVAESQETKCLPSGECHGCGGIGIALLLLDLDSIWESNGGLST